MKIGVIVQILKFGQSYLAVTELGGIKLKGARANTASGAARNLLFALGEGSSDDCQIALELALEGTTLEAAMGELPAAESQPNA